MNTIMTIVSPFTMTKSILTLLNNVVVTATKCEFSASVHLLRQSHRPLSTFIKGAIASLELKDIRGHFSEDMEQLTLLIRVRGISLRRVKYAVTFNYLVLVC